MTYRERPAAIFARGVFCALALGPLVSSTSMRSAAAAPDDAHAANGVAAELRAKTQRLLDAIAPGNVAVWEELLDPAAIQVDENDRVRGKAEILADLKPSVIFNAASRRVALASSTSTSPSDSCPKTTPSE